jgi:hypothetical protein
VDGRPWEGVVTPENVNDPSLFEGCWTGCGCLACVRRPTAVQSQDGHRGQGLLLAAIRSGLHRRGVPAVILGRTDQARAVHVADRPADGRPP